MGVSTLQGASADGERGPFQYNTLRSLAAARVQQHNSRPLGYPVGRDGQYMEESIMRKLGAGEREELLETLRARFEKNMPRHQDVRWPEVLAKLEAKPERLWGLSEMERTGGEPDVVGHDEKADEYLFFDCSAESPGGRRSLCYDRQALEARKKHKPSGSALVMATKMGAELLTEAQYRRLQELGEFDAKTSSWLLTPPSIRALGGAIFGDYRFGTVFVYHNGADSYYAARGFRCSLRV